MKKVNKYGATQVGNIMIWLVIILIILYILSQIGKTT